MSMLSTSTPHLATFHSVEGAVARLSYKERKALILMCRAQFVPTPTESFLYQQCHDSLRAPRAYSADSLHGFVDKFGPFITSSIMSGFVLEHAKSSPLLQDVYSNVKDASWAKEMSVMEKEPRPSCLNLRPIFMRSAIHESIHPQIDPNPVIANFIQDALDTWITSIRSVVHFPRMSAKAASRSTKRYYEELYDRPWFPRDDEEFSQISIERVYVEDGVKLGGVCEMRQKQYRGGIAPRTYYAQGGEAYHASKHLQGIFTKLVDSLPAVNHILRLVPTRVTLEQPDDYVFIYDLSSFTSNFHEHRNFIKELATYCRGTMVSVYDGRIGTIELDLGDMMDEYYDTCMDYPRYSRERRHKSIPEDEWVLRHNVASFLGVYGNLMTCTFLHGVVMMMATGEIERIYIAGDDGGVIAKTRVHDDPPSNVDTTPSSDDITRIFFAILLLGVVEWSKVFVTYQLGAVALKRSLRDIDQRLTTRPQIIWPSIVLYKAYRYKKHDIRFPELLNQMTRSDIRKALASETLHFLSQISRFYRWTTPNERSFISQYLVTLYLELGFPSDGRVPQYDRGWELLIPILPRDPADFLVDPLERVIRDRNPGQAKVKYREDTYSSGLDEVRWDVGSEFVNVMTPLLSYWEKMGRLSKEKLFYLVAGEDVVPTLLAEYRSLARTVYRFHIDFQVDPLVI